MMPGRKVKRLPKDSSSTVFCMSEGEACSFFDIGSRSLQKIATEAGAVFRVGNQKKYIRHKIEMELLYRAEKNKKGDN